MERIDLFDGDRRPLHKTQVRGVPIRPGEYQVFVSIFTVNSARQVLLTLRSAQKKEYPNLWENTMGGVRAGEESLAAAVRELFEETGITASPSELVPLGTRKEQTAFGDIYLLRRDISADALTLQEGETADARWVSFETLGDMIRKGLVAPQVAARLSFVREKLETYLPA